MWLHRSLPPNACAAALRPGPCASRGWPQKHSVEGFTREQPATDLVLLPGEAARSLISQAPHAHRTQGPPVGPKQVPPVAPAVGEPPVGGRKRGGASPTPVVPLLRGGYRGGPGGGGGGGGGAEVRQPLMSEAAVGLLLSFRVMASNRDSFALEMAKNFLLASSASSPGFLSGWKISAKRLYARFTSSSVQPGCRPSTKRALASGLLLSLVSAPITHGAWLAGPWRSWPEPSHRHRCRH